MTRRRGIPWPATALAHGFGAASALRGGRALHPQGVAFEARVEVLSGAGVVVPGASLVASAGSRDGVLRLSRAVGLPELLPDIYGAALRIPGAYGDGLDQDLLFASGAARGALRHVLLPARTFTRRTLSTLLPYEVGAARVMFLLRCEDIRPLRTRRQVRKAGEQGPIAFTLLAAPPLRGTAAAVARVTTGAVLASEHERALRFDPGNTGGGLRLSTTLNRWRPPSYRASQRQRHL